MACKILPWSISEENGHNWTRLVFQKDEDGEIKEMPIVQGLNKKFEDERNKRHEILKLSPKMASKKKGTDNITFGRLDLRLSSLVLNAKHCPQTVTFYLVPHHILVAVWGWMLAKWALKILD